MQASKPRLVLVWILCYVSLTFYEPYWRLLMRGLTDNREFEWDYAGISGVGMTGSYWIVVLISLMGLALLYFGWRKANRLVQWLLLIWITLTAASSLAIVISSPGPRFRLTRWDLKFRLCLRSFRWT